MKQAHWFGAAQKAHTPVLESAGDSDQAHSPELSVADTQISETGTGTGEQNALVLESIPFIGARKHVTVAFVLLTALLAAGVGTVVLAGATQQLAGGL